MEISQQRRLWVFVFVVSAAALLALWVLPTDGIRQHADTALLLAALTVLAGAKPVRISVLRTEVTTTHPFIFCGLAAIGPWLVLKPGRCAGHGPGAWRVRCNDMF